MTYHACADDVVNDLPGGTANHVLPVNSLYRYM